MAQQHKDITEYIESLYYADAFDCAAGFDARSTGWSEAKKAWCCTNKHLDCFDCQAGRNMWRSGWSESKKAYCCPKTDVCDEPETGGSFDCNAALSNFERAWSKEKKAYCCRHEQKGCHVHHDFDCDAALNNWERAWSPKKKHWCCKHAGKGCGSNSFVALSPVTYGICGCLLLALLAGGLYLANKKAS